MIVKDDGYTITDIPGVQRIIVQPTEGSESSVRVLIEFLELAMVLNYDLSQLRELNEALHRAHTLGVSMTKPVPGP